MGWQPPPQALGGPKTIWGHFVVATTAIFGGGVLQNCYGEFGWHPHLGPNSGMARQVGAAPANPLLVPTRARWGAWCAQVCFAAVVPMRARSIDFGWFGSQSACRVCQSPPNSSNSVAFGPVVPTAQLGAKPVPLGTYTYLGGDLGLAATCRHLGLPRLAWLATASPKRGPPGLCIDTLPSTPKG